MITELIRRNHVGPELFDLLTQALVADGRGDGRPGGAGDLDRRGADAPGAAVDEQMLAQLEPCLSEERIVGGGEHLGRPTGLGPGEPLRDMHHDPLVDDG